MRAGERITVRLRSTTAPEVLWLLALEEAAGTTPPEPVAVTLRCIAIGHGAAVAVDTVRPLEVDLYGCEWWEGWGRRPDE